MGCIYAHILKDETSEHYNWWYIGQAEDISKRWGKKRISNYKGSPFIYSVLKKYGWDAFDHIILENDVPTEKLDEREIFWIAKYHTFIGDLEYKQGFNLTSGGNGSRGPNLSMRGIVPKNIEMLREMKFKAVTCLNSGTWKNKEFFSGQTWKSFNDCAEYFGVKSSAISSRVKYAKRTLSGPIFSVKENEAEFCLEDVSKFQNETKNRQRKAGKDLSIVHTTGSRIDYYIHCEETGQDFMVVSDCLKAFNMSRSTLNGHLNYPEKHKTAKGYHFKRIPKQGQIADYYIANINEGLTSGSVLRLSVARSRRWVLI